MKAGIYYLDTYFILNNVKRMGILKHFDNTTRKYKKFIYFEDEEFGLLEYPLTDIKELYIGEE